MPGGWPTAKATNPTNAPIPRPLGLLGCPGMSRPPTTQVQKMQKSPPSGNLIEPYWIYLIYSEILETTVSTTFLPMIRWRRGEGECSSKCHTCAVPGMHWSCPMGTSLPPRWNLSWSFCHAGFGNLVPTSSKHFATLVWMVICSLCSTSLHIYIYIVSYCCMFMKNRETSWSKHWEIMKTYGKICFQKGLNRGFNHEEIQQNGPGTSSLTMKTSALETISNWCVQAASRDPNGYRFGRKYVGILWIASRTSLR